MAKGKHSEAEIIGALKKLEGKRPHALAEELRHAGVNANKLRKRPVASTNAHEEIGLGTLIWKIRARMENQLAAQFFWNLERAMGIEPTSEAWEASIFLES